MISYRYLPAALLAVLLAGCASQDIPDPEPTADPIDRSSDGFDDDNASTGGFDDDMMGGTDSGCDSSTPFCGMDMGGSPICIECHGSDEAECDRQR